MTSGQFHSWNLDVKLMPAFIGIQIIICLALASVTMCDQDANGECEPTGGEIYKVPTAATQLPNDMTKPL